MGVLHDTTSTNPKPPRSSKKTPSMLPSSGPDSATLQAIQSLQSQIAELEAKDTANGELTKTQAAKLEALEAELKELKVSKTPQGSDSSQEEVSQSSPSRLAHWCPW